MTGALDRLGEFALLLGGNRGDAAGDDLAALGHEALQQTNVLIVDAGSVLRGEGAALAAAEEWAGHGSVAPYSASSRRGRSPRSSRGPRSPRSPRTPRERSRSRSPLRIMTVGPASSSSILM